MWSLQPDTSTASGHVAPAECPVAAGAAEHAPATPEELSHHTGTSTKAEALLVITRMCRMPGWRR